MFISSGLLEITSTLCSICLGIGAAMCVLGVPRCWFLISLSMSLELNVISGAHEDECNVFTVRDNWSVQH